MKKLKNILHSNLFFGVLLVISIIYIGFHYFFFHSIYTEEDHIFSGTIISRKISENSVTFELKSKENLLVSYYASDEEIFKKIIEFNLGDQISIRGNLEKPSKNRNFHLFNYQMYLKGKKIFWILDAEEIVLKKKARGLYVFKNNLIEKVNERMSADYLSAFLLGDSSKLEYKDKYQELGISHLFAVSGMHIMFLTSFLFKIGSYLLKKKEFVFVVIVVLLGIYVWLLNDSASANRAYLLFLLSFLNKQYKWNFSSLKLLGFVFIILVFKNPFCVLQIGFQFSFVICFFLMLQKRQESMSYFKTLFFTSLLASMVSFPIACYHYHQFHFGAVLFNMLAVPYVSFILFPFSFLSFLLPILQPIFEFMISFFHLIIHIFDFFSFLKFIFPAVSIYFILLYYLVLILTFTIFKKGIIFFLLLMFLHFFLPYFNMNYWIDMIDIGQGDAILIRYPHLKYTILVDTGGIVSYTESSKSTFSQVDSILIPYFKALGIKKIDTLILTHGDQDHMGNALELMEKFPILEVIMNSGKEQFLESSLITYLQKKNILFSQISQKSVLIQDHVFQFLNSKNSIDENEDSLIFYTKLNKWNILFMGDAGKVTENELIQEYNLPKMDILKVGHHGSKNSSSISFLNIIKPSFAMISAGVNNRFGHPHDEVIESLLEVSSKIYVTSEVGGIRFRLGKKISVQTCLP